MSRRKKPLRNLPKNTDKERRTGLSIYDDDWYNWDDLFCEIKTYWNLKVIRHWREKTLKQFVYSLPSIIDEIKVGNNADEVDKFWYRLLLQSEDSIVDYYLKIKRCNDIIKFCKNHLRELFHKELSSEIEMLIRAEKENVLDYITAFSNYIRQASND
ncbi:hypothetical protein GLOIN_2v1765706 [Rhizophagus clarus]|uniref:Retrotransposon gag domain-containing protein n=1 Tax=Rhizophagus clarus TaxID=94130 RepID=A0A8H3M145_9GLOM|nr:hypothetical protein GLOIN_2v1765706 [Rhizophagus clarus]